MPGRPNILWLMTVEHRAGPAGLKTRHTRFAKSLVPQLQGAPGDPDRAIYAEGGYDPHEPHCFEGRRNDRISEDPNHIYYPKGVQQQLAPESVCRATMMRTLDYRLVRRPPGSERVV